MRYFIADLHFWHNDLNQKMDCRGFASAQEMNEHMINRWNSRVRENDEVVILGDFCMSPKAELAAGILDRLRGRKCLIVGNHDRYLQKADFDRSKFLWIENYRELNDNKRRIILSHYPIVCYHGQYWKNKNGEDKTYMLHGHVHNTVDELLINDYQNRVRALRRTIRNGDEPVNIPCHIINCFCMFSDYVPLTLDEWIETDAKRRRKITDGGYIEKEQL